MAQIVPLIILIPALGAFINIFWGSRLKEDQSALVGIFASSGAFIIALLLYFNLLSTNYQEAIINPFFFDSWIRVGAENLEIPWQMRVDTLSVTMMLVITGVGTLIHVYARGYMHGDPLFSRFFAYLNMFLAFMLVLVTGNNLLMLFVGWEGVGLMSYLLIGFWFSKPKGEGYQNANAARKAFIANRVGDFGLLMAMFLSFWTFGTLDFFKPGEVINPNYQTGAAFGGAYGDSYDDHGAEDDHGDEHSAIPGTNFVLTSNLAVEEPVPGEGGEEAHGEEHGTDAAIAANPAFPDNSHLTMEQMGMFGQAERIIAEQEASGEVRMVQFGPFEMRFGVVITIITLFMLLGASGKSAQIPLFVWLPDAMAGPTPVSALIHAATMVTAGVYMMVRSNTFFHYAELTSFIVAIIGMTTALMAGFIAMGQWDIKRVLAYSTVSQLGFMVTAVGVHAYVPAMFHLVTHAFFKALLFLGSGSVIHGVEHGHHHAHEHGHGDDHGHDDHHEDDFDPQDMRNMGGLYTKMPITFFTYLIGTLALAGIYPFAGFWSKDEILADSWVIGVTEGGLKGLSGYLALVVLLVAAGFTAFYMWRQIELVFFGKPRTEAAENAPESSWWMLVPLIVLAFFSLTLGAMNQPGTHRFAIWIEYSALHAHASTFLILLALIALSFGIGGIVLAARIYGRDKGLVDGKDALEANPQTARFFNAANARLWWDDAYFAVFINPFIRAGKFLADRLDWKFLHDDFHDAITHGFQRLGKTLARPVDQGAIDGTVLGIGRLAQWAGGRMRRPQNGYVRTYAVILFSGAILVLIFLLIPLFGN
ncbi:MAG: proton-conducting transporter membrane subunit [Chloroflexota bacterium]